MIYGIGTDIVQISRMKDALARSGERFAQKILGPEEWRVYQERKSSTEVRGLRYLATRFAAKEAFSKAIGLGMRAPMNWHAMQTLNNASGQPVVHVAGDLQVWLHERYLQARISISDETEYAIAFVIVEKLSGTAPDSFPISSPISFPASD